MDALRVQLETPNIPDESLALRFLNNGDVRQHSTANDRLDDGEITILEQIMSRYNVRLHTPANYGVDDNLVPRDVASRAAKERIDAGFGVNRTEEAVYLDFSSAIQRYGKQQATIARIKNPTNSEITSLGEKIVESKYDN